MNFEYLAFNIVIITSIVIAHLFYKKSQLPSLSAGIFALGISSTLFIFWDILVTGWFWQFNPNYIIDIYIFTIPLEEMLFFIAVPYACLYLWVQWNKIKKIASSINQLIIWVLFIMFTLIACMSIYAHLWYTTSVMIACMVVILLDTILRTRLFLQTSFILYLSVVSILTIIFNMYLTARPIVLYNEQVKSNINLFTMPMEDLFYGLVLISLVVILYEWFLCRKTRRVCQ